MNIEDLQKRIVELEKNRDLLQANYNATVGAIEECKIWISRIKESEANNQNERT